MAITINGLRGYLPTASVLSYPVQWIQESARRIDQSVRHLIRQPIDQVLNWVFPRHPLTRVREIRLLPQPLEVFLGSISYPLHVSLWGGKNVPYSRLINEIGQKLVEVSDRKGLPYVFTATNASFLNACTLRGGKVIMTRGYIQELGDESSHFGMRTFPLQEKVAAVLAHEIAHNCALHLVPRVEPRKLFLEGLFLFVSYYTPIWEEILITLFCKVGDWFFQIRAGHIGLVLLNAFWRVFWPAELLYTIARMAHLFFRRKDEFEADKYAMLYLKRAGYDPRAMLWVIHYMQETEVKTGYSWMDWWNKIAYGTHPNPDERLEAARIALEEIQEME